MGLNVAFAEPADLAFYSKVLPEHARLTPQASSHLAMTLDLRNSLVLVFPLGQQPMRAGTTCFVHLRTPRTRLCAWRTPALPEMPGHPFKLSLQGPLLQCAAPSPSSPSASLGTFPLAEFRSFWAWVAFAFRVRFAGAPLGLAWPGAARGAVG